MNLFKILTLLLSSITFFCAVTHSLFAQTEDYSSAFLKIRAEDYCAFLNDVAASDPDDLYDQKLSSDPLVSSIVRTGEPLNYHYEVIAGRENLPISYLNSFDEEAYYQWLKNSQLSSDQNNITFLNALESNLSSHFLKTNRSEFCLERANLGLSLSPQKQRSRYWNKIDQEIAAIVVTATGLTIVGSAIYHCCTDTTSFETEPTTSEGSSTIDTTSLFSNVSKKTADTLDTMSNASSINKGTPPITSADINSNVEKAGTNQNRSPSGSFDGTKVTDVSPRGKEPSQAALRKKASSWEIDETIPTDQRGRTSSITRKVSFDETPVSETKETERYLLKDVTISKLEGILHITEEVKDNETDPIIKGLMQRYLTAQKTYIEAEDKAEKAKQLRQEDLADAWKEVQSAASREATCALESIAEREGVEVPPKTTSKELITLYTANPNLPTPSNITKNLMGSFNRAALALENKNQVLFTFWHQAGKSTERFLDLRDAATTAIENNETLRAQELTLRANVASRIASSQLKAAQAAEKGDMALAEKYSSLATSSTSKSLQQCANNATTAIRNGGKIRSAKEWTDATSKFQEAYKLREQSISATIDEGKFSLIKQAEAIERDPSLILMLKFEKALQENNTTLIKIFGRANQTFQKFNKLNKQIADSKPSDKNLPSLTRQAQQMKEATKAFTNAALALEENNNDAAEKFTAAGEKWEEASKLREKIATEKFPPTVIALHEDLNKIEQEAEQLTNEALQMK